MVVRAATELARVDRNPLATVAVDPRHHLVTFPALWDRIAAKNLGVVATSRNWATVATLLAMAEESADR